MNLRSVITLQSSDQKKNTNVLFNFGQGNYGSAQLHTTLCQMAFLLGLTHSLIQKKGKRRCFFT